MKPTTSKSSTTQTLNEVLEQFIIKKNTFSLTEDEVINLKDNLYELLAKMVDNYQMICLDINQIWVYETCYYTFTFESMVDTSSVARKNTMASACVHFMSNFTDGDGQFINFQKLDNNGYIYQFNFRIS